MRRGTDYAANPLQRLSDYEVMRRGRRVDVPGRPVSFGNGGETAGDRPRCQSRSPVCDVESHGLRRCRQGDQLLLTTPGVEVAPVRAVGFQRGWRLGGLHESSRFFGEFIES